MIGPMLIHSSAKFRSEMASGDLHFLSFMAGK